MGCESRKNIGSLEGHSDRINELVYLTRDLLVSGDDNGVLKLWDLNKNIELKELRQESSDLSPVTALAKINNDTVAIAYMNGTLKLWDVNQNKEIRVLTGFERWLVSLSVSSDGRYLAGGSRDRNSYIWDLSQDSSLPINLFRLMIKL